MTTTRAATDLSLPFMALGEIVNPNSCDVTIIDGHVDHDLLRRAIAVASRRHPMLFGRLRRKRTQVVWESRPAFRPRITRQVMVQDTDDAVFRRIEKNVWGRRLPDEELIRFVATETPTRTVLQTISPHSCTDARAGARLASDIALTYTCLAAGRPPEDTPIDVPDRTLDGLFPKASRALPKIRRSLEALRLTVKDSLHRDMGLALPEDRPRGRTRLAKIDMGVDYLDALRARAQSLDSKVHPLLVTAVLRAREAFNEARGKAGVPMRMVDLFSMRAGTSVDTSDLYDVLVTPHMVQLDPAWSDSQVRVRMADSVRRLRGGDIFAAIQQITTLSRLPPRLALQIAEKLNVGSNLAVTNPGVVPYEIDRYGEHAVLDFFNFPQLFPPAKAMVIFTTFRGSLRMLMLYDANAFSTGIGEFVSRLSDALGQQILDGEGNS